MWQVTRLIARAHHRFDYHVIAPAVALFDTIYLGALDEIEHRCMEYLLQREIPRPSPVRA